MEARGISFIASVRTFLAFALSIQLGTLHLYFFRCLVRLNRVCATDNEEIAGWAWAVQEDKWLRAQPRKGVYRQPSIGAILMKWVS